MGEDDDKTKTGEDWSTGDELELPAFPKAKVILLKDKDAEKSTTEKQ